MTIPMELQHASEDFERFLRDAKEQSGLATRNQVFTMVQGVLQTFRRRLDVREALAFADVLPPILRAIFVSDWDLDEPKRPFEDRVIMTREVQALRRDHNFSPDTAIRDVAVALRKNVDGPAFERALAALPTEASEFWCV
ncbi:DUF2267 domain-containing protein [Microvirga sp. 17 mud 1-3]|uniref:DUF2267 domain-containing protein n=1 Tax=Microvirga sp. 17 mud 1-3 TaxID=2082949 RepID=UPI000D6ADBC7|nr:DUF2267 domain-containing protein [Microvirga sp. 17 mud 1-3]AWM86310.1 DUF2267 domain-containing protein [Microvirga sp. 17 mud 1-3]